VCADLVTVAVEHLRLVEAAGLRTALATALWRCELHGVLGGAAKLVDAAQGAPRNTDCRRLLMMDRA
jgi:hypothetical protein